MSSIFRCLIIPFCLMLCCITEGAVLHVPGVYGSIQSAIDAAQPGDTVLVAPGTYFENIDFSGKKILVTGNFALTHDVSDIERTIIDGSRPARPFLALHRCRRSGSGVQ
jgi:hypothetical protein